MKKLVCMYIVGKTAAISSREPGYKSEFQLSCRDLRHGRVLSKPTVMKYSQHAVLQPWNCRRLENNIKVDIRIFGHEAVY